MGLSRPEQAKQSWRPSGTPLVLTLDCWTPYHKLLELETTSFDLMSIICADADDDTWYSHRRFAEEAEQNVVLVYGILPAKFYTGLGVWILDVSLRIKINEKSASKINPMNIMQIEVEQRQK